MTSQEVCIVDNVAAFGAFINKIRAKQDNKELGLRSVKIHTYTGLKRESLQAAKVPQSLMHRYYLHESTPSDITVCDRKFTNNKLCLSCMHLSMSCDT